MRNALAEEQKALQGMVGDVKAAPIRSAQKQAGGANHDDEVEAASLSSPAETDTQTTESGLLDLDFYRFVFITVHWKCVVM